MKDVDACETVYNRLEKLLAHAGDQDLHKRIDEVEELGTGRDTLSKLAKADHSDKTETAGVVIVGQGALTGDDGAAVLGTAMKIAA